jgi:signal transduction histidine kinase
VNTPLNNSPSLSKAGSPIVYVYGVATQNMLQNTWLRNGAWWLGALEALLTSLAVFYIWRYGTIVAISGFFAIIFTLFLINTLMVSIWSYNLPFADTIFFASWSTFSGALWFLSRDAKAKIAKLSQENLRKGLMKLHNHFLDQFAFALSGFNHSIISTIEKHQVELKKTNESAYDLFNSSAFEFQDYLESIKKVTQIDSPKSISVQLQNTNITSVVQKAILHCSAKAAEKQQKISFSMPPGLMVKTDGILFLQIIENILSNAIKYSPVQSNIDIKGEVVGAKLSIAVSDQGPGIPKEEHNRIFEKFYRIQDPSRYNASGHGLGLYLSRYFAQLIQARISLDSQINQGTTFKIELPYKKF